MRATNAPAGQILLATLVAAALFAWCGTGGRSVHAQDDARRLVAWEYKQETSVPATDSELLDDEVLQEQRQMLLANGRDGWELICTHTFQLGGGQRGGQGQGGYGVVYVFKRPLR